MKNRKTPEPAQGSEIENYTQDERSPLLSSMEPNRPEISQEDGKDGPQVSAGDDRDGWFRKITRNITIEPMLFVKMVAEANSRVVADTLEIDRICRVNLNYSSEECEAMDDGNHTEIQNDVQRTQNIFNNNQAIMDSIIPLMVIMIIGPLTDKYGKKPAFILVLCGFIGYSVTYTMVYLNPSWPVEVLYLSNVFVDFTGTWVVFNMAVYSFIAGITTVETRTKRMAVADAIWYTGSPIGMLLGGFVYQAYGYAAVFIVSGVLWTLCLLYTMFIIKESRSRIQDIPGDIIFDENENKWGCFGYIISPVRSLFRERPNNGRIHILFLVALKLAVFLVQGHQMYLWARKVLKWGVTKFSTWVSFENASHQLGMVIWIYIGEYYHLHDCTIANGGLISIMLWSITLLLTGPTLWWLTIVASILGLFEPAIEPAIRSMLTAVAGAGEEGRILSALGVLEAGWLSVDRSFYTYLYNSFVATFPQINFLVQASISFALIVFIFLFQRRFVRRQTDSTIVGTSITHSHQM